MDMRMRILIKKRFIIYVLLLGLFCSKPAICGEVIVILNIKSETSVLNKKKVSDIFLGKKTNWDNGKTIKVVLLKKGETHDTFSETIVGTAPEKLIRFWKRAFFSGAGSFPKIRTSEAGVVKTVMQIDGSIGYINSDTPHENVKSFTME